MQYTRSAADLIVPHKAKGIAPELLLLALQMLQLILPRLIKCMAPAQAQRWLTRQYGPVLTALGFADRRDNAIKEAVRRHWPGNADMLPAVTEWTLSACRSGHLTQEMMVGMYHENAH